MWYYYWYYIYLNHNFIARFNTNRAFYYTPYVNCQCDYNLFLEWVLVVYMDESDLTFMSWRKTRNFGLYYIFLIVLWALALCRYCFSLELLFSFYIRCHSCSCILLLCMVYECMWIVTVRVWVSLSVHWDWVQGMTYLATMSKMIFKLSVIIFPHNFFFFY